VAGNLLQPADLIFTRGEGWLSRMIRIGSQPLWRKRTLVNHVAGVVEEGELDTALIVEALHRVKRHTLEAQYGKGGTWIAIFRPWNVTQADREHIALAAQSYVGRRYGYVKLLAHLGDWVLGGAYLFRGLARMDNYPICSWVWAHAYSTVGLDFGVDPGAAQPDDMYTFCVRNPDKYAVVRSLRPWP
jgi:hypothetical protein